MKKLKSNLIFTLFAFSLLIPNLIYSQAGNSTGFNDEFKDVEIYKPVYGYLHITNNWKIDRSGIIDEKFYLPYNIYDSNGILYMKVSGSKLGAQKMDLPQGLYYIKYKNENNKIVKYGVEIEAGKTTLIQ